MAEPDWSGAHRGLCLYVSRLLQPFLAKMPVAPPKPGDSNLTCQLSPESLQVLLQNLTLSSQVLDQQNEAGSGQQPELPGCLQSPCRCFPQHRV